MLNHFGAFFTTMLDCFAAVFIVTVVIMAPATLKDRSGTAGNSSHRDVEQEHRSLKDVQTDNRFDQVLPRDDDIKTSHHQKDHDPIAVQPKSNFKRHATCSLPANA